MIQGGHHSRFLEKALAAAAATQIVGAQQFYCDSAAQASIDSLEDDAHSALADFLAQQVRTQLRARLNHWRGARKLGRLFQESRHAFDFPQQAFHLAANGRV